MKQQLESIDTLDSRQFIMAVKRLADSLSYGTDTSPFLGSGTDYVQSRIYQPGDPVRSIDWRITARTGKHHVKEFETPKRMPCYLLVDSSASMTVSSPKRSKYATSVYLAGGLAFACLDRISPVSVVGVGETELRYNPSLSRDKIMQWLHKLRTYDVNERTMLPDVAKSFLDHRSFRFASTRSHRAAQTFGPTARRCLFAIDGSGRARVGWCWICQSTRSRNWSADYDAWSKHGNRTSRVEAGA
jgi:uncharacterized protein (DUF58 family)